MHVELTYIILYKITNFKLIKYNLHFKNEKSDKNA